MPAIIIAPIMFGIFSLIVFIILIRAGIKKAKELEKNPDNETPGSLFENGIFGEILNKHRDVTCDYCGGVFPAGTTKCPNCSANIKHKK